MLEFLKVSNLAVVEKAEVEFASGLNVITGETGSGKSVLMGALDLVLGGRAEASVIRDGAREAEVEAGFGGTVLRRTITAQGRSRAWIDEESVSVAELREFGRKLVDIHGPRANQDLLDEVFQLDTLDRSGGVRESKVFKSYVEKYEAWRMLKSEEAELRQGGDEDACDLLRYQVGEIEAAALNEDDETIAERHAAAAHAEELVEQANAITEGLGGDGSAAELLIRLQPRFQAMAKHLPAAAEWAAEAEELTLRLQELSRTVADATSALDVGEEDLESLDARLTVVNRLKRKYGSSVAEILRKLEEKRARLDALEHRDERLAEVRERLVRVTAELGESAKAVSGLRRKAGERLARDVSAELHDLGFPKANFFVDLKPSEFGAVGADQVIYMFEPNPGESARPLAAIASSGEIARVMLALKSVLAAEGSAATMVFDEIDANIGGEIGRVVGEKMRALALRHQVIAITHLPQSAVYGARHFTVAKAVTGGRTRTRISVVDGEARVAEIARMLGGKKLTSVVMRHAEELLQLSR